MKEKNIIDDIKIFDEITKRIKKNESPLILNNVSQKFIPFLTYYLKGVFGKKIILISPDNQFIKEFNKQLNYNENNSSYILDMDQILFYKIDAKGRELETANINTLYRIFSSDFSYLSLTVNSLMSKYEPKKVFENNYIALQKSDVKDMMEISKKLVGMGYEKVEKIESIGQFSRRGDILDIFSPNFKNPIRIVFFDNEIESIKLFDLYSQLSIKEEEKVTIIQSRLYNYDKNKEKITEEIKKELNENTSEDIYDELVKIEEKSHFKGIEKYVDFLYEENDLSIFNYLEKKDEYIFIIDNPQRCFEKIDNLYNEFLEIFEKSLDKGFAFGAQINLLYSLDDIKKYLQRYSSIYINPFLTLDTTYFIANSYHLDIQNPKEYKSNMSLLIDDLKKYVEDDYVVIISESDASIVDKYKKLLLDHNIDNFVIDSLKQIMDRGKVYIIKQRINSEFILNKFKLVLMNHINIFSKKIKTKLPKRRLKTATIKSFVDIKKGDIVVHENYGIGKFISIEKREVKGVIKDFIKIMYAKGDLIYVPITQMDKVQAYIGNKSNISLTSLSSNKWKTQKTKAKKAAEGVAKYLVELYAKRNKVNGYKFSGDTLWQKEFESLFPYEETQDQIIAIEDVKRDMENNKPMDRLICGDVGYGKTEVAIRAIFKATMDQKQSAFLVPTTILAEQHYETIKSRFSNYPINIKVLSRFRSEKEQKEIIQSLKEGTTDVLIGTHRMLSKGIIFKDLGLLVVDEEQRFGVKHKEILKNLKKDVDVLTLTATPIPRTLDMALSGIRDISVLKQPPHDRHPIITFVTEAREGIIIDAIERELNRGGQVYFVYNRVEQIHRIKEKLQALVPSSSIAVAHGQMSSDKLEKIMYDFMNKEYDILLCTTIIETGMDISNVNTIIVYDADKMGLSQLYQLRGRVGRSSTQAYAFFMYQKDKNLSEVAESRLKTIKEFTEFGSGFKVAMKDLEIRGAGNILGEKQHGHIQEIGYDLYIKLLNKAIKNIQDEKTEEEIATEIVLNVDAFIPDYYIEDEIQKMEIYKKISSIDNLDDYNYVSNEIEDRFLDMPVMVENLLKIAYIKSLGEKIGIEKIYQRDNIICFETKTEKLNQRFKYKNSCEVLDKIIEFLSVLV